jgi:hypothetical protein
MFDRAGELKTDENWPFVSALRTSVLVIRTQNSKSKRENIANFLLMHFKWARGMGSSN